MIEQVVALEQLNRAGSSFFFYCTHAGAEIDLIVDRGQERIGYEFKCSASAGRKDWLNLRAGIEDGVIHKGYVVYLGKRDYPVTDGIRVMGAESLFRHHI